MQIGKFMRIWSGLVAEECRNRKIYFIGNRDHFKQLLRALYFGDVAADEAADILEGLFKTPVVQRAENLQDIFDEFFEGS